jgi:hypothetical protein
VADVGSTVSEQSIAVQQQINKVLSLLVRREIAAGFAKFAVDAVLMPVFGCGESVRGGRWPRVREDSESVR